MLQADLNISERCEQVFTIIIITVTPTTIMLLLCSCPVPNSRPHYTIIAHGKVHVRYTSYPQQVYREDKGQCHKINILL